MRKILKLATIFSSGGLLYGIIELAWRGYTHISMFIIGGLCFMLIGLIDELSYSPPCILFQLPLAAIIVTSIELTSGIIINLIMQLDVWDYSSLPFNLFGQVCLQFSLMWLALAFPAIIVEDSLRVILFNEKAKSLRLFPAISKRKRAI